MWGVSDGLVLKGPYTNEPFRALGTCQSNQPYTATYLVGKVSKDFCMTSASHSREKGTKIPLDISSR